MRHALHAVGILPLLLLLLSGPGGCASQVPARIDQVDGRAVEVATAGKGGAATVVFEAGLGNDWTPWDEVASRVAPHARVFAYSRPGYGASDGFTTPRDPGRIVEELRALLAFEGVAPPYLLVGHSIGGTYMELFARRHPDEVLGVVLVDPRPRDFLRVCEGAALDLCGITDDQLATQPAVVAAEYRGFDAIAGEIAAAGPFGRYPVRVLTATEHPGSPAREALWESMLGELAAEAADGRQVLVPGAGHYLQLDRPDVVVSTILELLGGR